METSIVYKCILLSIFHCFELSFMVSKCLKLVVPPLQGIIFNQNFLHITQTLRAKYYLLVQPPKWEK